MRRLRIGMAQINTTVGVFRTIPTPVKEIVEEKIALLKEAGIGGVYSLGETWVDLIRWRQPLRLESR